MNTLKTTVASAAIVTSAALVLPALAQTTGGTGTTSNGAMDGELDAGMTDTDVGADTAGDTGTGTTIPDELPDTGGGWGANRS